jgi:hypothetical protein
MTATFHLYPLQWHKGITPLSVFQNLSFSIHSLFGIQRDFLQFSIVPFQTRGRESLESFLAIFHGSLFFDK